MPPTAPSNDENSTEFLPGTSVIYAMHGKCCVLGTETRSMAGQAIRFYKLGITKSTFSRSTKHDPAIWVPVATATSKGLRSPMSRTEAEEALKLLMSREYFFSVQEAWNSVHSKLEESIRDEGGLGLAKVSSYLHVLKKKQLVPKSEVIKLHETVNRLLFRELSDVLEEPIRILEEKSQKD